MHCEGDRDDTKKKKKPCRGQHFYTQSSHNFFSKDASSKCDCIFKRETSRKRKKEKVRKSFNLYTGLSPKSTRSREEDWETPDETKLEWTRLLKVSIILKFEIIFLWLLKDNLWLQKDDGAVDRRKYKASATPQWRTKWKTKPISSSSEFQVKFTFAISSHTLRIAILETYKKGFYGLNIIK